MGVASQPSRFTPKERTLILAELCLCSNTSYFALNVEQMCMSDILLCFPSDSERRCPNVWHSFMFWRLGVQSLARKPVVLSPPPLIPFSFDQSAFHQLAMFLLHSVV
jgi:hypothetical protein